MALRGVPGDRAGQGIEQDQQSAAARIDHPGLGQHRELVGGPVQGGRGGLTGCAERIGQARALVGPAFDGLGRSLQHRDHRARHQLAAHRRDHQRDRVPQRSAQQGRVHVGQIGGGGRFGRRVRQRLQNLGQDHPGVTAGPVRRPLGQCGGHIGNVPGRGGRLDPSQRRTHGEQHVRAGVGVCDGKHVQPVDLIGMGQQVPDGGMSPVVQGCSVQPPLRHHRLRSSPGVSLARAGDSRIRCHAGRLFGVRITAPVSLQGCRVTLAWLLAPLIRSEEL